jgi:DNA polymerase IIIc chi subunit
LSDEQEAAVSSSSPAAIEKYEFMQKVIDSIEVSDQAEEAAEGYNRNYQKCYGPLHGFFMQSDDQSSPDRAKR